MARAAVTLPGLRVLPAATIVAFATGKPWPVSSQCLTRVASAMRVYLPT